MDTNTGQHTTTVADPLKPGECSHLYLKTIGYSPALSRGGTSRIKMWDYCRKIDCVKH